MTSDQQNLIMEYIVGRMSYEEFVIRSGLDPANHERFAERALRDAALAQDAASLECALLLVSHFRLLTTDLAPILADVLLQAWHHKHEDIALALQHLRVPTTADALRAAALTKHAYLAHDDSHALARKCTWALADIGSLQARQHLEELSQSADPELVAYARKRLDNWARELQRKGSGSRPSTA